MQAGKLLKSKEVAEIMGLKVQALEMWRQRDIGPRYLKLGHNVRYRIEDVIAWLNSRPAGGVKIEGSEDASL